MISNWKRQSVFCSWLTSYILILTVPVLTAIFAYAFTAKVLEKEITKSNAFLLKRMQQQMDGLLENAIHLCNTLSLDAQINQLLKMDPGQMAGGYQLYRMAKNLQTYQVLNSSVDDFYIYFKNLNQVVSRDGSYDSQAYYNLYFRNTGMKLSDWLRIISGNYTDDLLLTQVENSAGEIEDSIAFVRTIPLFTREEFAANLVINLNESRIMDDLRDIGALNGGTVVIVDRNHHILFTSNQESLEGLDYQVINSPSGIGHQRVNGKKVVISHIISEKSEWKYLLLTPVSIFWQKADYVRNLSLLSLLLCLVSGGTIAAVALRRNYNPLELLVKSLEKYFDIHFDRQKNEYTFIHQAIDKAHNELKKVDNALRQQNKQLRTHFLIRLLQGKEIGSELTRERLVLYDIHFGSDSFAVLAFYVEDFPPNLENGLGDDPDTQVLKDFKRVQALISQTITSLLTCGHQGFVVDIEDLLVCLVSLAPGYDGESGVTILTEIANHSRRILEEQWGIRLLVSASEVHQTLTGIGQGYNEALQAMEFKKVLGIEELIAYRDLADLPTGSYYYPLEKEQQLINLIQVGDADAAKEILQEIFGRNFEQAVLPLKIARCLMFNLVSTMIKTVNAVSLSDNGDFLERLNPVERLLQCESIQMMKQEIFMILETFCSFLKTKRRERSKLDSAFGEKILRDKIISFVMENYADMNLGITFIAEYFRVNSVHLSRIFLAQTGEPLLDFINRTRVKRAKELFGKMSNLDEVARAVGYASTRTFTRAFKKYEGVTPGKFRVGAHLLN